MPTKAQLKEMERKLPTAPVIYPIGHTFEPIPFHRPLTFKEVRYFSRSGMMPRDQPPDGEKEERNPDYEESTWVKGSDVSLGMIPQGDVRTADNVTHREEIT
jgi:hypothetical protein